ncbi:hypothetical protein [Iodobacter fluviatilis]|uniref:hypothetical protein n=1 Tax=Iodobacter fluviatilis TaxID=537 RepID=UPI00101FE2BD|nr:hypothetical protein [Iodobacter fluviatilis]
MENLLLSLYEALGLELDAEEPVLWVDEDLAIYFDETAQGLEMCCPLGELPNDIVQLKWLLQHNYACPVVLAADADNTLLLALLRAPIDSEGGDLLALLELLINSTRALRDQLDLSNQSPALHNDEVRRNHQRANFAQRAKLG